MGEQSLSVCRDKAEEGGGLYTLQDKIESKLNGGESPSPGPAAISESLPC